MDTAEKEDAIFDKFNQYTITQLQALVSNAKIREEKLFYNQLLALKMGLEQEKIVGKQLL